MQILRFILGLSLAGFVAHSIAGPAPTGNLIQSLDVKGGFVVHLGCGDGKLTLALRPNSRFLVHGLDANPANVAKARAAVKAAGV